MHVEMDLACHCEQSGCEVVVRGSSIWVRNGSFWRLWERSCGLDGQDRLVQMGPEWVRFGTSVSHQDSESYPWPLDHKWEGFWRYSSFLLPTLFNF